MCLAVQAENCTVGRESDSIQTRWITYERSSYKLFLDAGGIEFLRSNGPYSKSLVVIELKHINNVGKLKEFVDQATVYVRPFQVDLALVHDDKGDKV